MAIIGWGVTDPVIPDLRSFEAEWGLPAVPVSVKRYGDTSTPDTSGDGATGEWELDTQASTGMAPNVGSEALYFAHHSTDADILAAIAGWVNDRKGPLQASASFGECENIGNAGAVLTNGVEIPGDKILEQAVAEGRTLFASTGDTGSSCPVAPVDTNGLATQGYPGLEWPSVSPWAVAVGGTDLTSDGNSPPKRFAETAWEFTGGGNSTSEPAGSYQVGVASTNCLFDANGNPVRPGRHRRACVPLDAGRRGDLGRRRDRQRPADHERQRRRPAGRRHEPLLAALARLLDAHPGRREGQGPRLRRTRRSTASPRRRRGVTSTTSSIGDNQPYPAKPGYDNTTGWGTPEVSQLMQDLTGRAHAGLERNAGSGCRRHRRRRAARSSPTRRATSRTPSRAKCSPHRERSRSSTS